MNKYLVGFIIFIIAVAVIIVLILAQKSNQFTRKITTTIGETTFVLEVADSEQKRQLGLSKRKSLKDNEGMIFIFDIPGYYAFWMKDMKFPIDIIFLNNEKIVTIYKNVPYPQNEDERLATYSPTQPANRVLELKAGTVEKLGLSEGETIKISL
jgi:hypothetical protein